jgi:hypothetical protein
VTSRRGDADPLHRRLRDLPLLRRVRPRQRGRVGGFTRPQLFLMVTIPILLVRIALMARRGAFGGAAASRSRTHSSPHPFLRIDSRPEATRMSNPPDQPPAGTASRLPPQGPPPVPPPPGPPGPGAPRRRAPTHPSRSGSARASASGAPRTCWRSSWRWASSPQRSL